MSDVDISKLKVTELREELRKHGLETKGRKEQLVKRLENFLSGSGDASLPEGDPALSQEDEEPVENVAAEPAAAKPEPMDTEQPAAAEVQQETTPAAEETAPVAEEETPVAEEATPVAEKTTPAAAETTAAEEATPAAKGATPAAEEATPAAEEATPVAEEATPVAEEATPVAEEATPTAEELSVKEEKTEEAMEETTETSTADLPVDLEVEPKPAVEVKVEDMADVHAKVPKQEVSALIKNINTNDFIEQLHKHEHIWNHKKADAHITGQEAYVSLAQRMHSTGAQVEGGEKRKRSHSPERPRSHQGEAPNYKRERRDEPPKMDSQDWVKSEELMLDRYNCDLNVEVINDGLTIKPNSFGGFGYMWGGVRANYGVTGGKVAFQMKTVKNLRIQIGEESVGANHVSRVGWSVDCGNYQLGEYPLSWGYGGTAKFSTNSKFTDYSVKYYNGDVVTCYLDMTDEEKVIMYFAKNDLAMGKAVEVPKSELNGQALFPAFATKNQILEVNFGQMERPWFPLKGEEGEYTYIGKVPVDERVRAAKPPEKKEDCEVLLLIGLPGAGKSYWAMQRQREEPEKRHYVLGTNNIIDKMKVEGLPRKNNYNGRWDVLFDQANECLRKMLETATRRLKNYILDQTNVYDTAQKRKMRPFAGFKRKAVVVLPTDKVFRERIAKRTKEEGKEVPESAVLEMKANFSMPSAPVEVALNPEANELALKEEEKQALAAEKAEEEKRVKEEEKKAKEEEKQAEKGEEKEGEAEVKEEKTEEKAVVDAAETEKDEEKVEAEEKKDDGKEETSKPAADDVKEGGVKEEASDSKQAAADANASKPGDKPAEQVKVEESEIVFDEIWFTELSGDVARKLLAQYVKEGQVKFPPGSRRFRREDRRIGRDDRGGYRHDYRPYDGGYRDRRDNYGGYNNRGYGGGGFNRYGGGGGGYQNRGYDNRNRGYGGGGGYGGNKGGPGGYRSGGYGKGYGGSYGGGGNYGGQGGNWGGGGGGWGGQGYGNQGHGNQGNWGGYGGNQGGYGHGYNQGYGGGGSGNYGGGGHSSGSWNQNNSYNSSGGGSGYGNNYGSGY